MDRYSIARGEHVFVKERFKLNARTISIIRDMEPCFGYDGFGEITFYRTYSRKKRDENGDVIGQEDWADCIIRVTEGTFTIRKDWYLRNHIHWDESYWQSYAKRFAIAMFKMYWMPPGRGLWAMGTQFIYERGAMALYNCSSTYLTTKKIKDHPYLTNSLADDIEWMMDSLMCGVGVGFGIERDDHFQLYEPKGTYDFVIPDMREGWCEGTGRLISAFTSPGQKKPRLIYDQIREAGTDIKGFGGICSGPASLRLYHQDIEQYCHYLLGDLAGYDNVVFRTDLANGAGVCVCSGNVRRSAELLACSINDPVFLDLKNYDIWPHRKAIGYMSNNSAVLKNDADFEQLGEIANRVIKNGEPGYINLRNLPFGRLGKKMKDLRRDMASLFNPCITGETKILLADGRGFQRIDSLINTDPLVYCVDADDELVVKQMRNIRKTGEQQKILKVIFDDGNFVRVTENHKIMLRDRSFVAASQLEIGQSVAIVNRYVPEQCDKTEHFRNNQYISVGYGRTNYSESRLIAEHLYGPLPLDHHVHHKDENKLNNSPDNLEVKYCINHLVDHNEYENNPNWSGLNNQQLINIGVALCEKLDRRFSKDEWQELGIVQSFSQWRKSYFGSFLEFAYLCADLASVKNDSIDTRTLRFYNQMLEQGYEADLREGEVWVKKVCEGCNIDFWLKAIHREHACCSLSCNNTIRDYTKNTETNRKINAQKKETIRQQQLNIYCDLKSELGRIPKKEEWVLACKKAGISFEISRTSSPFRNYGALQWAARSHNHKIVGIFVDGYADVYNGTVDQYHNYVIGGWGDWTPKGRRVSRGILNVNCGEIPLEHRETCNVSETVPTMCPMIENWREACEFATLYCQTVSLLPTHQSSTNRVVARNRRIGVSIIDVSGWKHNFGVNKITKWMREGYKLIRKTAKRLANEAGVPEPIRVTTIKPGGTTPKIPGRTPGIGHPNFHCCLRRMRVQQGSPIHRVLIDAGIPYEEDRVSMNTDVFAYPILQGPAPQAEDVSLWEQAMLLVLVQREWADNAVSNTLNFRPKWKLIYESSAACPQCDHLVYLDGVTDFNVPYTCYKCKYTFDLKPQIEEAMHRIRAIYGFPEVFTFNGDNQYSNAQHKIAISKQNGTAYKVRIYEFDPHNEEHHIEAVLSTIAPMTKSVALLPHSSKGAYVQMPEEGITMEEYLQLKSQIVKPDWTAFRGSDGIDERYCGSEHCEVAAGT